MRHKKEIAVIGVGKIGDHYMKNLLNMSYEPHNVVIYDIREDRVQAAVAKYGVIAAISTADAASGVETAIIAASTPAHVEIAKRLAENGVKYIFCEKPIAMSAPEAEELGRLGVQIYVAYLINFSHALGRVHGIMSSKKLVLGEVSVEWRKNRCTDDRPSSGDLLDESVHGLGVIDMLICVNAQVRKLTIASGLTNHSFVDEAAQLAACELDISFPKPAELDSSSSMLLKYNVDTVGGKLCVPATISSSFVGGQMVRTIRGTLINPQLRRPEMAFDLAFDKKVDGVVVDELVITESQTDIALTEEFEGNKLALELEAFLDVAAGGKPDSRLVDLEGAIRIAHILDNVRTRG